MVPDMDDTFVGGLGVSGEIVAMGSAVSSWRVGGRVLYHGNMRRPFGGFAEYATHDSRTLTTHPDVSDTLAASTPCAGGVGTFAIQIARRFGVNTVIATASADKHNYIQQPGCTHRIDYHNEDVANRVMEIIQNDDVDAMVELVKMVEPVHYRDAFMRGLPFHQLSLGAGHQHGPKAWLDIVRASQATSALLVSGDIKVPAIEIIDLQQIPEKLMEIRQHHSTGKIVTQLIS